MRMSARRIGLLSVLALIVAVVGFLALSLFGPSRPIVVSRQTTYLTGPIDRWGYVDYVEALRQQLSDGVTPENNAAVLIWQALGPAEILPPQRSSFYAELRIAPLPEDGRYFVDLHSESVQEKMTAWMLEQETFAGPASEGLPPDPDLSDYELDITLQRHAIEATERFKQLTEHTRFAPWKASEFPPLADWLKRNEAPLALVLEASERPKYYSPIMISNPGPGTGGPLISWLLPDVQAARHLAGALCQRAMLHLGEGRPNEAWKELQAAHRLARLLSQSGVLVQQLVALAIDQTALRADAALLHDARLSLNELEEIRQFLMSLRTPSDMATSIDRFERLATLDAIAHLARHGAGSGAPVQIQNLLLRTGINWNIPMQLANEWYDKFVAAMDQPTLAERRAAMEAVERELQAVAGDVTSAGNIVKSLFSSGKRSELVGQIMVSLFLPALSAAQHAEDRSTTSLHLLQVASALAIHRAEQGQYPASLDELPAPLRKGLPTDPFSGKAFLYEKREDGYVLWSVGRNLQDDGASGEAFCRTSEGELIADDAPGLSGRDDIVLRVPVH